MSTPSAALPEIKLRAAADCAADRVAGGADVNPAAPISQAGHPGGVGADEIPLDHGRAAEGAEGDAGANVPENGVALARRGPADRGAGRPDIDAVAAEVDDFQAS